MTTTFDILTVADSISKLSISGVVIKDADQLTDALGLEFAVLSPRPDQFITGLSIRPAEISERNMDVRYTLNYTYFHCKIGTGNLFANYSNMLTNLALIIKALADDATLAGSINSGNIRISQIGPVQDPSGNYYHGCGVSIDVLQFLET